MNYDAVIIGASTGGPKAMYSIIERFDVNFPLPIILIQHIPPTFEMSLQEVLREKSRLPVSIAEDDASIGRGIYIARGGKQLLLTPQRTFKIAVSDKDYAFSPSITCTILSALESGFKPITAIMTGLSVKSDGLDGAKLLRGKGLPVILQDKETCLIYGMPRMIKEAGFFSDESPLMEIPDKIARYAQM